MTLYNKEKILCFAFIKIYLNYCADGIINGGSTICSGGVAGYFYYCVPSSSPSRTDEACLYEGTGAAVSLMTLVQNDSRSMLNTLSAANMTKRTNVTNTRVTIIK